MKRISLLACCIIIVFTVCTTGCTNKKPSSTETIKVENKDIQLKLKKYMEDFTANNQFNGSILVARNEQILFENCYGMADADNKLPNTPKTVFEIGSITKQFTAAIILMLQEKGLLSIQDTIDKYIPDYPNGNNLKIYNLLNHTSGIPEYTNLVESMEAGKHAYTPMEIIELFNDKTLKFDPGTKFEYSNSNYILLGYIIEKVTKTSYEDNIKNNILIPFKMNHTGIISSKDNINKMAVGYSYISPKATAYEKSQEVEPTLPYAAGGIYSNTEDLLIWINNLYSEKLIKKESLKEMVTPYLNNYGFGWYVLKIEGIDVIEHGGNISGFTSLISRDINRGYVIIILSNKQGDNVNLRKINDGLLKITSNN